MENTRKSEKITYEEHIKSLKDKLPSIKYKDWFINQTYVPDSEDQDFDQFWEREEKLCKHGFFIEDTYFSGFLYWHLNFWKAEISKRNGFGEIYEDYVNPSFRDNEWIVADGISRAKYWQKGLAIGGSRRISKDLLNNSKLYTPNGEIEIGNAQIGQQIYDNLGNLTTITGVFPQGVQPVYKLCLRDGRELFCGLDHDWPIIERAKTKKNRVSKSYLREVTYSIRELLKRGIDNNRVHNGYKDKITRVIKESKFWIPNNSPVPYSHKDLPLDPYYFGLWLSDGTTRNTSITTMDQEIVDFIYRYGTKLGLGIRVESKKEKNRAKVYHLTNGRMSGKWNNPIINYLKSERLNEGKFIPDIYKYSSIEQRLALIQGLMDGDGACTPEGAIRFTSSIPRLADDFYFVVRSLGIMTVKTKSPSSYRNKLGSLVTCKVSNNFSLYTELPIFRLTRKLNNIKLNDPKRIPKITKSAITSIEYVYDSETTCISVDNDQRLFLTDDFTPTHNSTLVSSYISYGSSLNPHSQNLFVGLNGDDIAVTTAKVSKGLSDIPDYFQWMRVKEDWSKQVSLGIKDTKGKKTVFSEIFIRNLENGKKEESIAGTKPSTLVIEECGKNNFLRGFKAAVPGFTSPEGWICSPLLIFTGGDMEGYHDAKNVFMNPHSHNFLEYECLEGKKDQSGKIRKHGLFLGNKYRQEAKDLTTLGNYLEIEDPKSDLYNIPFWISNEEYAEEILTGDLDRLLGNPDRQLYHKEVMYFPRTVDDIFLNVGTNMYNTKACIQQQQNIELNGITGHPVDLYSDGEKICWKDSQKQYITEFPVERQSKDAPIMIYEMPEPGAPKFLYTAGIDPYSQDSSDNSTSLGAVYIYKRMHSLTAHTLKESFVASYVARPDTQEEWEENVRMLLMFYNAYALVENDEYSFCKYMLTKGSAELYLSPQPAIYKTLVVNGSQNRQFGLSRSSKKVREYLNNILKKYLEETIHTSFDEQGNIIGEVKGVTRVLDHTLLSELIGFGPDVNVDRQVAASLAIAMAIELDPMLGTKIGEDSKREQQTIDKAFNNIKKKTFKSAGSSFSGGHKLFKR